LFFGLATLIAAAIYAMVGAPHAAFVTIKASAMALAVMVCMLTSIIVRLNAPVDTADKDENRRARTGQWKSVLACLVITVFAIPSSFSGHNTNHHLSHT
jgi:NADH:ubiquinone oxidoreductase subunit 6 (subunit J)